MTPHFRIPFRMNNGENHHLVLDQPEHHAVWEALEKRAPPILVDDFIAFGRREHAPYRSFRRIEELLAKARPTVFVPARSFLKVCCRRRAEQQVPQRRVRIWRKTSSHGMPSERPARASPSSSSERRSISARWASVSGTFAGTLL